MQCLFSVFKQTFFQSSGYCHIFIQQFLKFFWIFLYIFSAFFISYHIKWQEKVFEITEKDKKILPPIVKSATIAGEYKGIKVIKVAGHDTQCAVCAMPAAENETSAFLSCGTWSLIGCENDKPILSEKSMKDELSNELGANKKINYLKNISGLWLIQEIRRNFADEGKKYSYNDMEMQGMQKHLNIL